MSVLSLCSSQNHQTTLPKKRKRTNPVGITRQFEKLTITTLPSDNHLREAVKLPPGEDKNEWLAINTVDLYNQINMLYATLEEFCTATTCPIMNAGSRYEYRWADGVTIKKPTVVSAPEYIENLMNWIEIQIDDETIFPQKTGESFPPNFEDYVKRIFTRLFRVYAHMYHSHFQKIVDLEVEDHLNTCFKNFVLFVSEYKLVDESELCPLKDLVEHVLKP
ncbi:hypothetical protein AALP_AA8G226600 [Arabis alpina]|uniref:Uncharacterized protein n=1 Tax=Arabis alpina TaxID=50452 RepID=A0A087G8S8_ARAAL|nr:hypothetical protein AALP_AA8G226600 [Arabis alpina]